MQAVINACQSGRLNAEVAAVVASNDSAGGIEKAKYMGIPAYVHSQRQTRDVEIMTLAKVLKVDLIVLAGYLGIVSPLLINAYKNKIINVHPSLLPKHGGKEMYGIRVHESVIASGDKKSGATVHYVDEGIDEGDIILQRSVDVLDGDNAEDLQKRVLEVEHELLVEAIEKIM